MNGIELCTTKEEIQDNRNLVPVTFVYFGNILKKCVLYVIKQNLLFMEFWFFQLPSAPWLLLPQL